MFLNLTNAFVFDILADDEQSDFFFESGPASGIPGVKSWWDKTDDSDEADTKIGQMLHRCLEQLTPSAQDSHSVQRIQNMVTAVLHRFPSISMSSMIT